MSLLQTVDLCRSFGEIRAVDQLSMTVRSAVMTGFVGANGAGKTTCFNAITGIYRLASGTIRLGDTDLWIEVTEDRTAGGEEAVFGGGKSIRESMAQGISTRADGAAPPFHSRPSPTGRTATSRPRSTRIGRNMPLLAGQMRRSPSSSVRQERSL